MKDKIAKLILSCLRNLSQNSRIHNRVHIRLLLDSHGDQVLGAGDELDGNGEVIVPVNCRITREQAGRSMKP